jgi:arginine utilization regulatory protein
MILCIHNTYLSKGRDIINAEAELLKIYASVLDEISDGVHVIDKNGKSIIYNKKMVELESMQKDEVLNKHLLDVFQFDKDGESTLLQALKQGKTITSLKQTYFNEKGKQITSINKTYPIIDDGQIVGAIEIANDVTKVERMIRENMFKKENTRFTFDNIIGKSEAIQEVISTAKKASRTSSSVLIVGETGTGKELFAQSIHNSSSRSSAPFVSQNCAALPDTLIESLLFGTKKGAFTGSIERPGLFEQAEGGTLFLDEINSLSPLLQAKLLRVLQERTFRRIGDTVDKKIDVRILAAINEDPIDAIANNHMRKDLFYRLGVVTVFIPPLRERKEDIPLIVNHFIEKYNQFFNMEVIGVSSEVQELFFTHDWPGNVRELENIIEGAMNLLVDGAEIHCSHLPFHSILRKTQLLNNECNIDSEYKVIEWETQSKGALRVKIEHDEKEYIKNIIDKNRGNLSVAAREMGISRQSLQYRLKKYKLR